MLTIEVVTTRPVRSFAPMMPAMDNVIRPKFGSKPPQESQSEQAEAVQPVRMVGDAAGYRVGIIRDEGAVEGDVYKVVVWYVAGSRAGTVAVTPATPEGLTDAEVSALAVLRALELTIAPDDGPAIS